MYDALESCAQDPQVKSHPLFSKINFKELHRRAALREDLEYYYGDNYEAEIEASAATLAYCEY